MTSLRRKIKDTLIRDEITTGLIFIFILFVSIQFYFVLKFRNIFIESETVEVMNRANYLVNKVPLYPIWKGRSWIASIFFSVPLFFLSIFNKAVRGWGLVFVMRSFSIFISTFSIYLTYLIGKKVKNKKIGFYSAFLFAFSPLHLIYSFLPRDFNLAIFSILLGIYLLFTKRYKRYFLSGAFFGLAFVSRYESILLTLVIGSYYFIKFLKHTNRSDLIFFSCLFFGFLIVSVIFQGLIDKIFWNRFLTAPISYFKYNFLTSNLLLKDINAFFYLMGLIKLLNFCFPIFIIGVVSLHKEGIFHQVLFLSFFFFLLFFTLVSRISYRYLHLVFPFVGIFTAIGLNWMKKEGSKISVFFLLLIFLIVNLHSSLINFREYEEYNEIDKNMDKIRAINYLEDRIKTGILEKRGVYLKDSWLTGKGLINHILKYSRLELDTHVRIKYDEDEIDFWVGGRDRWLNRTKEITFKQNENINLIKICGRVIIDKIWITAKNDTILYDFGENVSKDLHELKKIIRTCKIDNEGVEVPFPERCKIVRIIKNRKISLRIRLYSTEMLTECICNEPFELSYLIVNKLERCDNGKLIKSFGNVSLYSVG